MLRILPTAAITARILVTARMMIIKPCLLLQHKKLANTKREQIKEGEKAGNITRIFVILFREFFWFRIPLQ